MGVRGKRSKHDWQRGRYWRWRRKHFVPEGYIQHSANHVVLNPPHGNLGAALESISALRPEAQAKFLIELFCTVAWALEILTWLPPPSGDSSV